MPGFPEFEQEIESPMDRGNWWDKPITTVPRALEILERRAIYLSSFNEEGIQLRKLLDWVDEQYQLEIERAKEIYPNAYIKPSYEQALMLNCWWCGITFPICFSANRIGKTFIFAFNGVLWIFPNNPDWVCFKPYVDHLGRDVHVLQRPPIENLLKIQQVLRERPELAGDPMFPYTDIPSGNQRKFATLQKLCGELFAPAWPAGPVTRSGSIWLGAPDNKYHKEIILRIWKRVLPAPAIIQWSESDLNFRISTQESGNPRPIVIDFSCKSYESEDTKWSGDAVLGIILTEGIESQTLDEIKQRIIENGFLSWDYTPYEAANVGKKSALAKRVYDKKEELPLVPFVFTRFSARNAPDHILPPGKKADLIRMWTGKAQGQARLDGDFFTTSPAILSKLDRSFHCLQWNKQELFDRFPNGQLFRSFDPGYDHPSVCGWFLLSPRNEWYCYRFLSKSGMTISERCKTIIEMSGNVQAKRYWGKRPEDFSLYEAHPFPHSEVFNATLMDYHNFKIDEVTGQCLSLNYIKGGLAVIPSVTIGDADRATKIDDLLDKVPYYTHPVTGQTPSSRMFFLINEPGVGAALDQMETLFWERYKSGDQKGMPKDQVPQQGDDELDVTGQIAASPFIWGSFHPPRIPLPDNSQIEERFATLQNQSTSSRYYQPSMIGHFGA